MTLRERPSVGGHKFSGAGEKIGDFLVKNSMTNNSAIVEIKTPQTRVLQTRPYRRDVYGPSTELVAAVNQALDQKYYFEQEIAQKKSSSRVYDIESYAVRCCLLIGTMPTGEDRLKSFELYRGNSKNVDIITFDELLEKLRQLKEVLTSLDSGSSGDAEERDVPF